MSVIVIVPLTLLMGGFATAVALEYVTLRLARRWSLYAHPNERSSHRVPTPSAGGVAFVIPIVAYLGWVAAAGDRVALVLASGGALLALIGLIDDVRELSARVRLGAHLLCAAVITSTMLPELPWLPVGLLIAALVWQINLYNFMDGIDALAGTQCLVFCVGAQIVAQGVPGWPGDLLWLTSGTVLGFLVFNGPPARVFMGDVGSAFLGLLTGAVAILLWRQSALPLAASLILLGVFWFDATYTLIVRLITGQPFTQAHRSHLYQKLAARRGHLWTTGIYLGFAICWLLPLAWVSAHGSPPGAYVQHAALVLLAVAPLAVAAWRQGAGRPEPHENARDL